MATLFGVTTLVCLAFGKPMLFWGTVGIMAGSLVVLLLFIALFYLPVSYFGRLIAGNAAPTDRNNGKESQPEAECDASI